MYVKFNGRRYRVSETLDLELMGFILGKKVKDVMPRRTEVIGSIRIENGDCYAVLKRIHYFIPFLIRLTTLVSGIIIGAALLYGYYTYYMSGLDLHATYQSDMIYKDGKVDAYIKNNGEPFKVYLNVDGTKSETVKVLKRESADFLSIELEPNGILEGKLVFKFNDNTKIARDVSIDTDSYLEGVEDDGL